MTNLSPISVFLATCFCSSKLKQFEKFKTIAYDFKTSCQVVLLERSQFVLQKLGMKFLEMGKDMKIMQQCLLSPYKVQGNFFAKKLCMGGQNYLGKFMGGCFTWGLIIRSRKGVSQWLKGFKGRVKLVFFSLILTWVTDILFQKLTSEIGDLI